MSLAKISLKFTVAFEAEVLVELMLRYWEHPFAEDESYRNNLLEAAAEILRSSVDGQQLLEGVDPPHMNLIAALWTAETFAISNEMSTLESKHRSRKAWLKKVRRSIPSSFCNPEFLE